MIILVSDGRHLGGLKSPGRRVVVLGGAAHREQNLERDDEKRESLKTRERLVMKNERQGKTRAWGLVQEYN